ncbi:hypothetical protein Tco_0907498 [Tanacetum coccineum]|uniref:Gag-Pol polyprotein n=1 Tax=Tanacetum coccineum TaxID=301880 RepID=A0ABQ5CMR4_9ASTR
MHNNIMEAGSRDRPPMLASGRYAQWKSCFMRYVDTKPNGAALKKCILQGPYVLSNIILSGQLATDNSPTIPVRTIPETFLNISLEDKARYEAEAKAIHLILTGNGDDIYSTVDACKTTHDMWIAIERLLQEWSRFVTVVKQTVDLGRESYHKLFDILKQYQKEVNEICAEKITRNANLLALVVAAQQYPDTCKEIAKPITPLSESASEEDSDPEQAQRDKDMRKTLALIAKYMNDNQTGQFKNQMTLTVAGARETVGSQECRKPKRAKDYTYNKEKMLLCKQAEKGVPLQAEQSGWLEDTDKETDEDAHYSFMAKIQEVLPADSGSDVEPLEKVQYDADYNVFSNERQHPEQTESINDTYMVEKVDSNVIPDSSGMCDNDNQADQNAEECDDERVVLANLIVNLKLDTEENKKIQK